MADAGEHPALVPENPEDVRPVEKKPSIREESAVSPAADVPPAANQEPRQSVPADQVPAVKTSKGSIPNQQPAAEPPQTEASAEPAPVPPSDAPENQAATGEPQIIPASDYANLKHEQGPDTVVKPSETGADTSAIKIEALTDDAGAQPQARQEGSELEPQPSISMLSHSASSAESGDDQPPEDVPPAKVEKQPTIGQLQLKELLSGTSMAIVEHAQKLAEAPLIGTAKEEPVAPTGTDAPPSEAAQSGPPLEVTPPSSVAAEVPPDSVEPALGQQTATASGPAEDKKPTIPQVVIPTDDQFPGPDHEDPARHPSVPNALTQEEEPIDAESYEAYTVPEGAEKMDDVPSVLKRYLQLYNDEKLPIAKFLKLEDEDKLNEAAAWDIQPSYQTKPTCIIRGSVLEKVLRGVMEYRLGNYSKTGMDPKQIKQIMPVLTEDIATSLAQCRFPSYKYCYFVTIVPKNRQDVIISTRQIWDPQTDRRVIAKMDNRKFHASVIVHFLFHP